MLEIQMGTSIHIQITSLVDSSNFQCSLAIYCTLGSLLMYPQNATEFFQLNLNFLSPPCTLKFSCFTLFQYLSTAFLLTLFNHEYLQAIFRVPAALSSLFKKNTFIWAKQYLILRMSAPTSRELSGSLSSRNVSINSSNLEIHSIF